MNQLDGRQVSAKALGWDARPDGDFALDASDLPQLRTQIGFLFVNYVDDLDYTQYVVNGIPVDPDTIQEVSFTGSVLTASAAHVCQDCGFPRAEFAGTGTVPRATDGKWCKGAGCSSGGRPIPPPPRRPIPPPPGRMIPAPPPGGGLRERPAGVLADVPFSEVQIAYRPRHPDGKADPGEIVWAKIPFEEDPTQSKDRPVLIIGRTKDGANLVAVQLTSKDGTGRVNVGSGDWDKQDRDSFVKLDRFVQIDDKNYRREGSYMKKPAFQAIVDDLTSRRNQPKVQLAVDQRHRPDVSCFGCGLPISFASVPRANDGKWCKGAGCQDGTGKIESSDDIAKFAKQPPHTRVSAPAEWFATDGEARAAKAKANQKARDNVQPTKADIAQNKEQARRAKESGGRAGGDNRGGAKYRRARGEALFAEFAGKKKFAPCTHCGIKTSPGGRGGFAPMEQDKILTLNEGGKYGSTTKGFPNIIPSCAGCNKSRGETPFPVRPSWERGSLSVFSRAFRISPAEATDRIDDEVIAFPLGWDDPEMDTLDGPVQGLLFIREVVAFWGSYTQFVVGGVVIDPDHIYDIDDPLVASASIMCMDCGGWVGEEPLVAAGSAVPRDPSGKWCSGIQCQGQQGLPGLEKPLQGPMILENMTAGQKAAWTKKQNKMKASSAAEQAKLQQATIDTELRTDIATGGPVSASALEHASDGAIDEYLEANVSSKNLSALSTQDSAGRRQLALDTNDQHIIDSQQLGQIGYPPGTPKGANESKQTLAREKGLRRPTGGPADGTYKEYTNSEVEGMTRQQQERFVRHHRPTALTDPSELSDVGLRNVAVASNKDYITKRNDLIDSGVDPTRIPMSEYGATKMANGAPGLASGTIKQPPKPSVASVPKVASTGVKPPEWDSWSGAKKAAWTKKQNKGGPAKVEVAKPAGWDSWGSGKKAAWTKKQNAAASGSVSTSGAGTHSILTGSQYARNSLAEEKQPTGFGTGKSAHMTRYNKLQQDMDYDERSALSSYTGSGYKVINRHHKYGEPWPDYEEKNSAFMDAAFKKYGSTAPAGLIRGKGNGPMSDLDYSVGTVFTEPGFGSWSTQSEKAIGFSHGVSDKGSVITKLVNTKNTPSLPGTDYEYETIMPRGMSYRVVSIQDYVKDGKTHRYMEVEVV